MIGTNNAAANTSEQIAEGVKLIVEKLRAKLPTSKVLILAIFPRGPDKDDAKRKVNEGANEIVKKLADNKMIYFLDIGPKFLGPDGTWAPRPVPFHARLAAGERARGAWNRAAPPADVTLALVIVRPGADPLDHAEWTHRPALAQVRVAAPSDARPSRPWTTLAGLFVAAVVATALAWGRALSTPRPL